MTAKDTAAKLNTSLSTVYRRCRSGQLNAVKVDGRWVITFEIESGHVEKIGGHEVVIFHAPSFRRRDTSRPQRWNFAVDGDCDAFRNERNGCTFATAEEAIAEARLAIGGDTTCLTCGLNSRTCDC